jgi:hypothetical protein
VNRYERQVERLLRAYPPAWREERGEEMHATLLDLAGDGRRSVPPRVAVDLLMGGWSERARRHVRSAGALGAGWRSALGIAVVAQLVVSVVWLRDWALTGTPAVLAHMLGNASAVTYGLALGAFVVGAIAWLAGHPRLARVAAVVAITAWVLTVVVFHALSNPVWSDWVEVVVWSYLAVVAGVGMFQPPPVHQRLVGTVALIALLAAQLLSSGVTPMAAEHSLYVVERSLPLGLFDRGLDTLHTGMRWAWTLLAIGGLALLRMDVRPAVAACWLLPFVALDHLAFGGPIVPSVGAIAALAVVAIAIARFAGTDPGRDLTN